MNTSSDLKEVHVGELEAIDHPMCATDLFNL